MVINKSKKRRWDATQVPQLLMCEQKYCAYRTGEGWGGGSLMKSGTGTELPLQPKQSDWKHSAYHQECTMERAAAATGRRTPTAPECNISTSTLAFDQHFTTTAKGTLHLAEIVFGMLVWILVGGTDYFGRSALCWVMFVAVSFWVLAVCLFVIYLTGVHHRIPQVPWTTLSLYLDCCATALYLVAAVVDALSVKQAIVGRHNYNCWAASAVRVPQDLFVTIY
ncbi:CKLF-like MARVEL transmembrane domain-containing protein 8%2C partial [Xyrichtys novacula]|uniref:CKLF-like MARVEL transmembrane domain-containing protein 8, partial n=1 Tax=Xyrichtys novacula TaxID=13765 RepID=A0AAV1FMQ2_XYRNO|nr:CKLF-like MARVEL transmembrane domain-containing protein 8%2C partial [Xyrichtys novacula]